MAKINKLDVGAIWICNSCNVWWGSQIGKQPNTSFLYQLDLAGLLPTWEDYRGWKMNGHQASICVDCGMDVIQPALQAN